MRGINSRLYFASKRWEFDCYQYSQCRRDNADANTNADADADANTNADADSDTNTNADAYAETDADTNYNSV